VFEAQLDDLLALMMLLTNPSQFIVCSRDGVSSCVILFLRIAAFVELIMFASLTPARATEPPDNVAKVVAKAAQVCKNKGGKPNTSAVLSTEDLNGDGVKDWIADYSKLKCEGVSDRNCLTQGCTLEIFYLDGKTDWVLEYQGIVQNYNFGKNGDDGILYTTAPGATCNKPISESCHYNFRLPANGHIIPTSRPQIVIPECHDDSAACRASWAPQGWCRGC
jgi:hypothetical protein